MTVVPEEKLRNFAKRLHEIGGVKFGNFKTKIGLMSPVYYDFRVLVSYPQVLDLLTDLLILYLKNLTHVELVCGVPYTALPIATILSSKTSVPMVMRRKETKDYGTKRSIEGAYQPGMNCLIIEDVVTSGSSILETVKDLKEAGIACTDVLVLLNREQGGADHLKKNGIKMHALFTATQLLEIFAKEGIIDEITKQDVCNYIRDNQVDFAALPSNTRLRLTYGERAKSTTNPATLKLLRIMEEKKTNLCFAADLTNTNDLLDMVEKVGPYICLLKTHIDIVSDFQQTLIQKLKVLALRFNFMLFEDRKFADIGKTVQLQYSKGLYEISSWAELITAHSLTGRGVLDGIQSVAAENGSGVFLLAQTSAADSLIDEKYTKATLALADQFPNLITGIVCQSPLFLDCPHLLQLTPGVQLGAARDNLGQQYNSPESVIGQRGADVAVVGRGISEAKDVVVAAEKYKDLLWKAYLNRIEQAL